MKTFDLGAVTAYALAVKNGFKGTEEEWLASLVPEMSVGEVKTLEPTQKATATMGGTAKNPVLNLAIPCGKNGHAADWNQNDPSQPDYVKNRTHYEGKQLVEVLGECTLVNGGNNLFGITTPAKAEIVLGEHYIVNFNGVEYPSTAYAGSNFNMSAFNVLINDSTDMDTGEGLMFIIGAGDTDFDGIYGMAQVYDGSTSVTLSIRQESTVITPLPGMYLPEGVPWVEEGGMVEIPVTGEWGEDYEYDDNGELVATTYTFMFVAPIGLEVGKTYTVNWNGTEYECTGLDMNEISGGEMPGVFIGNLVNMGGEDNGLPFMLQEFTAEVAAEVGFYGGAMGLDYAIADFSIYQVGETIHKLDNRCLGLAWLPTTTAGAGDAIFDEILSVYVQTSGMFASGNPNGGIIGLVAGKKYYVTINDETFEGVAQSGSVGDAAWVYIGDAYTFMDGQLGTEATGESFCVADCSDATACYFYGTVEGITGSTSVAYKVQVEDEVPNKLPAKFLPDGIPSLFNVNVTVSNGKVTSIDKTFAEIYAAAMDNNKIVRMVATADTGGTMFVSLVSITSASAVFGLAYYASGSGIFMTITVNSDDTASLVYGT